MPFLRFRALPALQCLLLLASLGLGMAHADIYADVLQLQRNGKSAQAMETAQRHIAANPNDPQMRFLLGTIQSDTGDTAQALQSFEKLTQEYPELPEPYNNLAVLLAARGDYDKARQALETAVRTNPNYAIAHENLGDIYAKLASLAYERSLALDTLRSTAAPKLALARQLLAAKPKAEKAP